MASKPPPISPSEMLIEEEQVPDYNLKRFLAVKPGDLLDKRYRIVLKMGWGTTSTVWLAEDTKRWWWNSNRYVALKLTVSDSIDVGAIRHEETILPRLVRNSSHRGFPFVRTPLNHFEVAEPGGSHLCLVYEPMRETFLQYQRRWEGGKLPPAILKVYLRCLLQGLEYLHDECRVIHTDLKLDNILMGFEHSSVLYDFIQKYEPDQTPQKARRNRSVYLSTNYFGPLQSLRILPKITDFGLAQLGDNPEPLTHPIQPPLYHAPEVILGMSWTYSADVWNLGVLLWNMLEGRDLFEHLRSHQGSYDARAHLAEMMALIGAPPESLVKGAARARNVAWHHPVSDSSGKLCRTACEYFGGPFFGPDGQFLYGDPTPFSVGLDDSVQSLEGEDKRLFLEFARRMLRWLPEERATARELLADPWLGEV